MLRRQRPKRRFKDRRNQDVGFRYLEVLMNEVFIVAGVRTAIGTFGGALKDTPPSDLGALVAREAVKRSGIEAKDVGHVVFGQVIHTEPRDMYISRVAAVNAGIPVETPALTVNRLCGSGLQAIVSAAQ